MRTDQLLHGLSGPVFGALLLGACAAPFVTHPPVPPIPAEQVTAPPRSTQTLIWQPGHFEWTGAAYRFYAGEWVERAGHGTLWQDGYWRPAAPASVWVPGHWTG